VWGNLLRILPIVWIRLCGFSQEGRLYLMVLQRRVPSLELEDGNSSCHARIRVRARVRIRVRVRVCKHLQSNHHTVPLFVYRSFWRYIEVLHNR
jgi:hypothetical protein